jgi:hypothetical protein
VRGANEIPSAAQESKYFKVGGWVGGHIPLLFVYFIYLEVQ